MAISERPPPQEPSLPLRACLLGPLRLTWGTEAPSLPRTAAARSLLGYLLLHHDRPLPREPLAGTFWPDRPDAAARKSLSNALWQIHRSLGPAAGRLVVTRDTVSFNLGPADTLDVEDFATRLRRYRERCQDAAPPLPAMLAELNAAVELYRADLLEDCYDDWVLPLRERLREDYLWALEQLLLRYKQWGDDAQALACAQRLVAADPLRESAHSELMRLYHALGRPRAALEQYAALRRLLAEELGVAPAAATSALYREIRAAQEEDGPVYLPAPGPELADLRHLPLIGRAAERSALLTALQAASRGHGGVALIEGPAGVGKTRLVEELTADARWRGFQVGLGRADPLAASAPYQALRDALTPLLTPLRVAQIAGLVEPRWIGAAATLLPALRARLPDLPPLAPLGPQQEQQRLRQGLAHCVAGLSMTAPILLVVEDVHWADAATLAALPDLAAQLRERRALVVLTGRSAEVRERAAVWERLAALNRAVPLLRLGLAPLEPADAASLVQRALGAQQTDAPVTAFAQRLRESTGGNALAMVEMLRLLLAQGEIARLPEGGWRFPAADGPMPIPDSVQELVRSRLAMVDPAARRLLELAAVAGSTAGFDWLARAGDIPPAEVTARLGRLCQGEFLVETEVGYRFDHELVREFVYRALGRQKRKSLHRRAGEALEALDPERVETLAYHFDRGGVADKALAYTLQAGRRAAALYDHDAALSHYRRALALAGSDLAARWDALSHQEEVLDILSRRQAQKEVLGEMARLADKLGPAYLARTRFRQGLREVRAGETTRALALLEEAAGLARAGDERELLGHCLINIARAWWRVGEVAPCRAAVEEARDLFQATANLRGELQVWNMLGNLHLGLTGDYAQALRCFEEDLRVADDLGNSYAAASARGNIGIVYTLLGCYERSQEALAPALEVMTRVGDRHWQGIILVWQATNLHDMGEALPARAVAEQALRVCREASDPNFEIAALELLGQIALEEGSAEQACAHFAAAARVARAHHQTLDVALAQVYLARACLQGGRPEEAERLSREAIAALEGLGEQVGHSKDAYFARYQVLAATQGAVAARPYLDRAHQALQDMAAKIQDLDLRRSFLENVPDNRAIMAAHRRGAPAPVTVRQTVRLPALSAPTGRPLRDDEWVAVGWTPARPEDEELPGKVARRQHRLRRLLAEAAAQGAAPTVDNLAAALGVDARTIKRDLAALRAAGHPTLTRGRQDPR